MLIKEKALSWANLTPACIVDKCPNGYELDETDEAPRPLMEYMEKIFKEYEKLKAKGRPEYVVKEKEALKICRTAVFDRPYYNISRTAKSMAYACKSMIIYMIKRHCKIKLESCTCFHWYQLKPNHHPCRCS